MIDRHIIILERLPDSHSHRPNFHEYQPTMDENIPLGFYENVDRKNWTVEFIQRGLHISNDTYVSICSVMEKEMSSHEVLGLLLKQPAVKRKLQPIFIHIIQRFPATFDNIPHTWRDKCLAAIAQKCNYNMRRRRVGSVSPAHVTDADNQDQLRPPAPTSDAVGPHPSKCPRHSIRSRCIQAWWLAEGTQYVGSWTLPGKTHLSLLLLRLWHTINSLRYYGRTFNLIRSSMEFPIAMLRAQWYQFTMNDRGRLQLWICTYKAWKDLCSISKNMVSGRMAIVNYILLMSPRSSHVYSR